MTLVGPFPPMKAFHPLLDNAGPVAGDLGEQPHNGRVEEFELRSAPVQRS